MKIRKYLLAMCSLIMIACDNDENQTLCYGVPETSYKCARKGI